MAAAPFWDELLKELGSVPIGKLPQLIAAARAARRPSEGFEVDHAEAVAEQILATRDPIRQLDEIERTVLRKALEQHDWVVSRTAQWLDVDRKWLERKIARYKIAR